MATLFLDSTPSGAMVSDETTGELLGTTPFSLTVPVSKDARGFRVESRGYARSDVAWTPDRPEQKESVTLVKRRQTDRKQQAKPKPRRRRGEPVDPFAN
jgi:hypothetical protein